jgi:hypothetical protein
VLGSLELRCGPVDLAKPLALLVSARALSPGTGGSLRAPEFDLELIDVDAAEASLTGWAGSEFVIDALSVEAFDPIEEVLLPDPRFDPEKLVVEVLDMDEPSLSVDPLLEFLEDDCGVEFLVAEGVDSGRKLTLDIDLFALEEVSAVAAVSLS